MRYGLLLLCLAGCAQVSAQDDIERVGTGVAIKVLTEFKGSDDKPQESAAPPQVSEPVADEHTATPQDMPKYMPPDEPPQVRRVLLFTDTSWCAPCRRQGPELEALKRGGMKVGDGFSTGMDVKIIEGQKHADWHQQFRITSLPTFVLLVDGVETDRRYGFLTADQIREFGGFAPEVATQRPFADPWRQELLRKHGRQAVSAHTNLDAETVALPTTQINLRSQCVEFSGQSRESRLNRWFSVSFGAGSVSHNGSTVEFSNPPELRFHLFANREGEMLDSLKAIEFTTDSAAFHMTRFGTIHFRVK